MKSIERFELHNVRIIRSASIRPSRHINLICGDNASGKSSLLEAIHLLALGRSFRTHRISKVVTNGEATLTLFAHLNTDGGEQASIGVERGEQVVRMRVNGRSVHSTAELARELPVQIIGPDIHSLIEEGPRNRRQFLDWGLFHVEQGFLPVWRSFRRALQQRNAGLKRGLTDAEIAVWHGELAESAMRIDRMRRHYVLQILPLVQDMVECLLGKARIDMRYLPGWGGDVKYEQHLDHALQGDRSCGYTRYGPHRAELAIYMDGTLAREQISRGQQKILGAALRLAQVEMLRRHTGSGCALLVDDMPSELDEERRRALFNVLRDCGAQVFATATHQDLLGVDSILVDKMFHVEHGVVKEVV